MAIQGPIPVEFGTVFPDGAYAAGKVEMVRDFDRSSGDRVVQQIDKDTGLPLWVVEVIDAEEDARQRTVKVKIAAQVQPVLPSPAPGLAVHRGGVRRHDGHPLRGLLPLPGQRQETSAARGWRTRSRPPGSAPPRAGSAARRLSTRTRRDGPADPAAHLCLRVGPVRGGVRAVPAPAPMFVIGTATLVSLTLPEQLEAGHVDFARQLAARRGRTRWRSSAGTGACRRCRTARSRTR